MVEAGCHHDLCCESLISSHSSAGGMGDMGDMPDSDDDDDDDIPGLESDEGAPAK